MNVMGRGNMGRSYLDNTVRTIYGEKLSNRRGVTQDAIFRVCTDSIQLCYGRVSKIHCM